MSSADEGAGYISDPPGPSNELLLLTKDDCHFCDLAKQVLEQLAGEFELSTSQLRLECAEGMELAERTGVLFPPALLLNGRLLSYGRPSYRRLRRDVAAIGVPTRSRGAN